MRAWLEIDTKTLLQNILSICKHIRHSELMAVIKADAYGIGMPEVAEIAVRAGIRAIGVATVEEALTLRDLKSIKNADIFIIGTIYTEEVPYAIRADITLPVTNIHSARIINEIAAKENKRQKVHILIDTGMGRLGILYNQALNVLTRIKNEFKNLEITGIYSHFPEAYIHASDFTKLQIDRFKNLLGALKKKKIYFRYIHMANSDAVTFFPETYKRPFNMVRMGIALHGVVRHHRTNIKVECSLKYKTRIIEIRSLPEGSTVGYNRTHTLTRETRVATLSAGYADGLPFALSNTGHVVIKEQKCNIIGRISMDYTTVELPENLDVKLGEEVICLDDQSEKAMSVSEWAKLKKTHEYDILCSMGRRIERIYL